MFQLAWDLADKGQTVLTTTTTNIRFPSRDQVPVTLVIDNARVLTEQAIPLLRRHVHLCAGSQLILGPDKLKGVEAAVVDQVWRSGCFDWIIVEADGARCHPVKASDAHEPVMPACTACVIHVTGLDALGTYLDEDHVHRPGLFSRNTGLAPGAPVDGRSVAISCVLELWKACGLAGSDPAAVVCLNKADDSSRMAGGHAIAGLLQNDRQGIEDALARQALPGLPDYPDRRPPWPGRVIIAALTDPDPVKEVVSL